MHATRTQKRKRAKVGETARERDAVIQGERERRMKERDSRNPREQEKRDQMSSGWVGVRDIYACGWGALI